MAEGLKRCVIKDLKPGSYLVRLYFAEPDTLEPKRRLQNIKLQGHPVVSDFDVVDEAGGVMQGTIKEFTGIEIEDYFTLELSASDGKTIISGIELIRYD